MKKAISFAFLRRHCAFYEYYEPARMGGRGANGCECMDHVDNDWGGVNDMARCTMKKCPIWSGLKDAK